MSSKSVLFHFTFAFVALTISICAREANAQLFYDWINSSGGSYSSGVNWFPGAGAPPGPNDGAGFYLNATYTVNFSADHTTSDAEVGAGTVTFDLDSGGTRHTYNLDRLSVVGTGQLLIDDGAVNAGQVLVQNTGKLTVAGPSSADDGVLISGNINVNGGSMVDNRFEVNFTAVNLTLQNAGSYTGRHSTLNDSSIATVSGVDSTWTSDSLRISTGSLTIENGGSVSTSQGGTIGVESGSTGTVTVSGVGSTWAANNSLIVGSAGTGTLTIDDGGDVFSSSAGFIGFDPGSTGEVTVNGAGSTWTMTRLSIGGRRVFSTFGNINIVDGGTGTLSIADGALVEVTQETFVGRSMAGQNAMIDFDNGTLTTAGLLAAAVDLSGIGTINTRGLVTDIDLVFDQNHGLQQQLMLANEPNQNITLNLDVDGNESMGAGYKGQGSLTIADGIAVSSRDGYLGYHSDSIGTATITGANSTWTSTGSLRVGFYGTGSLTIEDGGSVSSNGNSAIGGDIGLDFSTAAGIGTVTVTGAGSTWTNNGQLNIGALGAGTLTIEDGGGVSGSTARIGFRSGSTGTVTVSGASSTWTTLGVGVAVGVIGSGSLNILSGGAVSSTDGYIAFAETSTGTVTVSGAGSIWTMTGRLSIAGDAITNLGEGGTGTLTIGPGGTVDVAEDIVLFQDGLLNLEGGTLTTARVIFRGGGAFQWTSGTLHVGTFGDLQGPGLPVPGNLDNQGGTLAPGQSVGSTTITGNYTQQTGAALEIEIGGPASSDHDFVSVWRNALVGGELQLALIDGFVPTAEQTFTIMEVGVVVGSLSGAFDNAASGQRLTTTDGLGSFLVHYGAGSLFDPNHIVLTDFLASPPMLPGDYNNDGAVNAADYALWRNNLGSGSSLFNDGTAGVALDDYDRWVANFGTGAGAGSSSSSIESETAAVPEPPSLLLISLGFVIAGILRRTG